MLWKREEQGMWIALIKFDRQVEARTEDIESLQEKHRFAVQ
jgi:hypothetical protein